ncbi:MAG TPA: chemotaxis protein CheW [Pyrinomonadaceae bacterium]|nr:chemotaxis protein CheW [Pyrinomonadaceae bacterium]
MINDANEDTDLVNNTATSRKLRLFTAGSRHFAISEDQIATVAEWREPAPLPHAPDSVIGVLGIQGRMLTVLDLARMSARERGAHSQQDHPQHRYILALRGDEQLALAVDELGETVETPDNLIDLKSEGDGLVLAVFKRAETEISIIGVNQLFPTAIQGRERRRRRF